MAERKNKNKNMANDDQTKSVKAYSQNLYDEIKPHSPTSSDMTKGQPSVKEKKSKKSKDVPRTSQTEEQRRHEQTVFNPGAVSVFPEENESHGSNINEGADHIEINKKEEQLMTLVLDDPTVKKEIDKLKKKYNAELLKLREENNVLKEQVAHLTECKAEDDRMRDGMFRQIQCYIPIVSAGEQIAELERQAEETFGHDIQGSV